MISVLINGICGKMGRAVYSACQASDGAFSVVAGVDRLGDASGLSCPVYRKYDDVAEKADVIIDFSIPAALSEILHYAQSHQTAVVIGTTGLGERDLRFIRAASERIPVFQTGNMSLGVNLQMDLVKRASAALGTDFDVEIIESHHRTKIDAPSSTALMLANAVSSATPEENECVFGRHDKNRPRARGEIGIHSVRGGTIVGEHEVIFAGNDEIIEITHKAFSKQVFVRGALRAAQYILEKGVGLYDMRSIVTESDVASRLSVLENQAVVLLPLANSSVSPASILDEIAQRGASVDMIAFFAIHGGSGLGFSLASDRLCIASDAIHALDASLLAETRASAVKLTLEGAGMAIRHGVAAQLLTTLQLAQIPVYLITTSETKIELCVDALDAAKAIPLIQSAFLL